jgi:hypothetical protein
MSLNRAERRPQEDLAPIPVSSISTLCIPAADGGGL